MVIAANTGPCDHPGADTVSDPPGIGVAPIAGILPIMAKAKRRKLRARRSKANHGRRPNAGRG
jgi:hypothetical protein